MTLKLTSFSWMMAVRRYLISSPRVCRPFKLTTHRCVQIPLSTSVIFIRMSFSWKARMSLLSSSFDGTISSSVLSVIFEWNMIFWMHSKSDYFVFSMSMTSWSLLSDCAFNSFV